MFTILCRFRRAFALLGLVCLLAAVGSAAENDYISFKVNCNGVLGDVIAKGYSPLVIGYAVDKDGNQLAAEDFEKYPGATLRVPKSALNAKKPADMEEAKTLYAAIAAAHSERRKAIGAKKYDAAADACTSKLNPPPPPPSETAVSITGPKSIVAEVGETIYFQLFGTASSGYTQDVVVTLANPKIGQKAGVFSVNDQNGKNPQPGIGFKGLQAGETTLTATFTLGGKTVTKTIPVKVENSTNWGLIALIASLIAALGFLAFRKRDSFRGGLTTLRNRFRKDSGDGTEGHTQAQRGPRNRPPTITG